MKRLLLIALGIVVGAAFATESQAQFRMPRVRLPGNPSVRPSVPPPTSPIIDARPFHRWMATTKPFPNATTGIKGKLPGGHPYEVGMRNTTVSDLVIGGATTAAGAPPGTGSVVSKAYKSFWGR